MKDWKKRPTLIEYWPDGVDFLMGVDESGISDLKGLAKQIRAGKNISIHDKYFTLTGVVMNSEGYEQLKREMNDIKFSYWSNGLAVYKGSQKRVCFHSKEIRNKSHPFNKLDDYESFINSLTRMITKIPTRIISASVDKVALYQRYITPMHPYHLAVHFILERYCQRLNQLNKKGIIILESRGKKEDKFVLKHILNVIENGTNQNPPEHFRNLAGAYFNPKWWDADDYQSSFVILELADLISYPIYKYVRGGQVHKDKSFECFETKFFRYPSYIGWGLKVFP